MRFIRSALVSLTLFPGSAAAEGRFALVLGAKDYDYIRDLENPVEDAIAMADLLRGIGFEVTLETDRNAERTRRALEDFAKDADGADLALVYYAGHGAELQGVNHLLPTDTAADTPEALADSAIPLSEVVAAVTGIAPAAILIVDACRDDPFVGTPLESLGRSAGSLNEADPSDPAENTVAAGFARVGRADGLIYAFSTAPGDTAFDGDAGHSPFAEALLRHLAKPGLDVRTVLTLVSQDVYDRTRRAQLPYFESALPDLVFVAGQPTELSERDALLLAMADLNGASRAEVETLAAARDMPLAPLFAAILTLDPNRTSQEDRTRTLIEAADAYADLQSRLALISPTDPRVEDLRTAAAADLDLGQFSAAQEKFQAAITLDDQGREAGKDLYLSRTVSQAETLILSADAARVDFDYQTAITALTNATALYAEAETFGLTAEAQFARTSALSDLGDLHTLLGDTTAALAAYQEWLAVARALADAAPDDTALQRDLSISQRSIGDVLLAQGDLPGAETAYRAAFAIAQFLIERDQANTLWQHDLSINNEKIGDALLGQGDLLGALDAYDSALAIAEALAALDPANTKLQLDLSTIQSKVSGFVFSEEEEMPGVWDAYINALTIAKSQAARDPADTELQRNLMISQSDSAICFTPKTT